MRIERHRIVRAVHEGNASRGEAVVHVINGSQGITHVLEGVDRERHIELSGRIKLLARAADELQLDAFPLTEVEHPSLEFQKEPELGTQRFNGCYLQPLAC